MPDVVGRMAGRNQHGRDGGLRGAVHVRRAEQQLRGLDPLGDQPEETQLDITRAQHGAGIGVLESYSPPPGVAVRTTLPPAQKVMGPPAAILADSGTGVTTFDQGVMGTIASGQAANQDVVAQIMNRSVKKITLGKPEVGPNTVTLPVTLSGASTETTGSLVLIQKTIDGTDLNFLTSFSRQ